MLCGPQCGSVWYTGTSCQIAAPPARRWLSVVSAARVLVHVAPPVSAVGAAAHAGRRTR